MNNAYDSAWSIAQILLRGQVQQGQVLTRDMIAAKVDLALQMDLNIKSQVDRERLVADLESSFTVWMGNAVTLEHNEDHIAWLNSRKSDIDWKFWKRYQRLLQQKRWAAASLEKLDELTYETLGRLEDPNRKGMWSRRGLVVGHVQSGKTANYTGLICKAADAGYKVIIVLAGIHKSLRSQTQIRLDEGFLGYESKDESVEGSISKHIGVGLIDPSIRANTITTRSDDGDFKMSVRRNFHIGPGGIPLLFVVKKNARVLANLNSWVERFAQKTLTVRDVERRVVPDVPLLVIDDEADNASIDTRAQEFNEEGRPDPDHDPTAINKQIRKLLHLFERNAYVGYTATPFANIFIHDVGQTDAHGADLFPRSFITNLPAPSDYVGPVRVFGLDPDPMLNAEEREPLGLIRHISDHAESPNPGERNGWIPPVHKKEHKPRFKGKSELPPSLRTALHSFVLVCAARRARGQINEHNSMLVHVTRFTDVQKEIFGQVKRALKEVQDHLELGTAAGVTGLHSELRRLWDEDFVPTTQSINDLSLPVLSWSKVSLHLKAAVAGIKVKQINGTAGDVLDYEEHRATGLSVIAVGGDKLARGLTLEGLSVSYFLRASRMYDTLMQMGRWFGYRPGYLDLCRLYMTEELDDWFQHVTMAGEELRQEFDRMSAVGGFPADYGLKVRSHSTLLITSPVKMRNGVDLMISFDGDIIETTNFDPRREVLEHNLASTVRFLEKLGRRAPGWIQSRPSGSEEWETSYVWPEVSAEQVAAFLATLHVPQSSTKAVGVLLSEYIKKQLSQSELSQWTVVLFGGGEGVKENIAGLPIGLTKRQAKNKDATNGLYKIRRLVSPRDEAIDLDAVAYARALELTKDNFHPDSGRTKRDKMPEAPSGPFIRQVRSKDRGLLIIYPLDPAADTSKVLQLTSPIPIGWAVSFPASDTALKVPYRVNNVYWEQQYGSVM
ncbi:hypothetical protein BHS09_17745 [Myxococcus xanthus]|uniref:Putative endonuclease Z1 domain-containing protein n=1 Tax=Myxococcus xanthus TaxID=34 RepID=A0AAE6G0M0_MYXXA|nr:Z1 domain-containing protein [Myxococcus xanthus]QDE68673.1 hypothetical protein BHS09_17745 [Myxococcus xanthus]QDE75949.1 hypothetical protein BHS08_17760 [Myxococcus xanthus]